jgi:hypothetical protein
MREEGQPNFNYMTMLVLYCTILLMSMWARHMVRDAKLGEEGVKLLILASPIRLNSKNLSIKPPFNKTLKLLKLLKHLGFELDEINPGEFSKVIDEANIILLSADRFWCRTPDIGVDKLQGKFRHTCRFWIRQLMTLSLLTSITNSLFYWIRRTQEIILTNNLLNYSKGWMAKTTVPRVY